MSAYFILTPMQWSRSGFGSEDGGDLKLAKAELAVSSKPEQRGAPGLLLLLVVTPRAVVGAQSTPPESPPALWDSSRCCWDVWWVLLSKFNLRHFLGLGRKGRKPTKATSSHSLLLQHWGLNPRPCAFEASILLPSPWTDSTGPRANLC